MNRQGVSSEHNITYESLSNDMDSASLVYNLKQRYINWAKNGNDLNVGDTGKMAVQNTGR